MIKFIGTTYCLTYENIVDQLNIFLMVKVHQYWRSGCETSDYAIISTFFLSFSFQSSNSTFDLSFQLFQNTFEAFNRKFKDALHNHSVKARTENFWNLQSQIQMCVA